MAKAGALVHVRHPGTVGWKKLAWGVPAEDRLGDLPKLVELMLREETAANPIDVIVIGTTASEKEGLLEGEYTKKYLLDHFSELRDFPRLKKHLQKLPGAQLALLRRRLEEIKITPVIKNTATEIVAAARIFKESGVNLVFQVTAASHGPRCVQLQAQARAEGHIPAEQLWFLVISDMCFEDSTPLSTFILEQPHRGDDPLLNFKPTLAEALQPYFYELPAENKKKLIKLIQKFMQEHVA